MLRVAPQTMKNQGSNHMSLNISEIPNEVKQKLAGVGIQSS